MDFGCTVKYRGAPVESGLFLAVLTKTFYHSFPYALYPFFTFSFYSFFHTYFGSTIRKKSNFTKNNARNEFVEFHVRQQKGTTETGNGG